MAIVDRADLVVPRSLELVSKNFEGFLKDVAAEVGRAGFSMVVETHSATSHVVKTDFRNGVTIEVHYQLSASGAPGGTLLRAESTINVPGMTQAQHDAIKANPAAKSMAEKQEQEFLRTLVEYIDSKGVALG